MRKFFPIDLAVIAQRPLGDQVRMLRTVEVALIPVFQFGVFSDSDLGFFSSPQLDFAGRVHTNGDLYLGVSGSATLTFHDKITAYGNVVRNQLPNGLAPSSSYNNDGTVNILTASKGCDIPVTACRPIAMTEGSVVAEAQLRRRIRLGQMVFPRASTMAGFSTATTAIQVVRA